MTLNIDVDMSEVVSLSEAWRRAPEMVAEELSAAMWESELLIEREVKERTPVGAGGGGGLKGSIAAREPRVLAEQVVGVVASPLNYALPVEFGSRPHFPPVQPLADWARAKLGVSAEEAEDVGFLIARKISREGTKGAFMFTTALREHTGAVERIFTAAARRVAAGLAKRRGS